MADYKPLNALGVQPSWGRPKTLGGLLDLPSEQNMRTVAELLSMEPGLLGSVAAAGLTADDLRKGEYGSAALNALGLLPAVPAMAGVVSPKLALSYMPKDKDFIEEAMKALKSAPKEDVVDIGGYKLLAVEEFPRQKSTNAAVVAFDANGAPVGSMRYPRRDSSIPPLVQVEEEHRRKGIATGMYDFARTPRGGWFPYRYDDTPRTSLGELFRKSYNKKRGIKEKTNEYYEE